MTLVVLDVLFLSWLLSRPLPRTKAARTRRVLLVVAGIFIEVLILFLIEALTKVKLDFIFMPMGVFFSIVAFFLVRKPVLLLTGGFFLADTIFVFLEYYGSISYLGHSLLTLAMGLLLVSAFLLFREKLFKPVSGGLLGQSMKRDRDA